MALLPGSALGKGAAALSYLLQTQGIRGGNRKVSREENHPLTGGKKGLFQILEKQK